MIDTSLDFDDFSVSKSEPQKEDSHKEFFQELTQLIQSQVKGNHCVENTRTRSMGVRGQAEVTIEWGGSEGTKVSMGAEGGVSDKNGNHAEVKGSVDSDGRGNVSVSGGTEKALFRKV